MNWRRYGRNAILIEFAREVNLRALERSRSLVHALSLHSHPRVVEVVAGYTTLLVEFDLSGGANLPQVAQELVSDLEKAGKVKLPPGRLHKIPVNYNGPDLERVAKLNALDPEKVIKSHSKTIYTVYLLGFSPGFPYMGELPKKLHTPRLEKPRPKVLAGSVAIGGAHTGIYTVESPGGWNVIGHTHVKIFDLSRATNGEEENAFLLKPGDRVQFVPER